MKDNLIKFLWGVILLLLSGLFLAAITGYVEFTENAGTIALIVFIYVSAISFVTYFLRGVRQWGWLFPALFSAAAALTIAGVFDNNGTPVKAYPFLLSLAIPFVVGFYLNRKQWELLIPAWLLTIIAVLPPLIERINPDVLLAIVIYATSLPFLVGYMVNSYAKWALFISAVLGFIGIFSFIDAFIHGNILGPLVMLLVALPLLITFLASRRRTWALVPSGIFFSIGLIALLVRLLPVYEYIAVGDHRVGLYTSLLLLGFAATFAMLWRLDSASSRRWARYPTIGFLAASVLAFLMGESFDTLLPLITILIVGIVMLSTAIFKERITQLPSS